MKALLKSLLALLVCSSFALACGDPPRKLVADVEAGPYQLARIRASGVSEKAALVWRITPNVGVSKATTARGLLEFVAPPGVYDVELLVITTNKAGGLDTEERHVSVEFRGTAPPIVPPPPKKDPEPKFGNGKLDPAKALAKMSFPPYGCTATVIGPRRADGKWDVLSAAHCVAHVRPGSKGTIQLLDGRKFTVTVGVVDAKCDVSWMTTDDAAVGDMPYANLAPANPAVGTQIWHAGYGIDKPGNREEGTVTGAENGDGQINMSLSVSSGDSGGGIFRADTDELISCVCCTTAKGQRASVWGGSVNKARALRPKTIQTFEWNPIEIPILEIVR